MKKVLAVGFPVKDKLLDYVVWGTFPVSETLVEKGGIIGHIALFDSLPSNQKAVIRGLVQRINDVNARELNQGHKHRLVIDPVITISIETDTSRLHKYFLGANGGKVEMPPPPPRDTLVVCRRKHVKLQGGMPSLKDSVLKFLSTKLGQRVVLDQLASEVLVAVQSEFPDARLPTVRGYIRENLE